MSGREEILARVREALADVPRDEPARWSPEHDLDPAAAYARSSQAERSELVERFEQRCGAYRATVTRCADDAQAIAAAVAAACARHSVRSVLAPDGLDPAWLPDGVAAMPDHPMLTPAQLDESEGVLTSCAVAIATTGTIVLDGGPGQGRRALSLVPDLHICVVQAGRIVNGVPEALALVAAVVRDSGQPLTLISGPSATSDIELQRVEGVHGPRRLEVVLAG